MGDQALIEGSSSGMSLRISRQHVVGLGVFLLAVELGLRYLHTVPFPWVALEKQFNLNAEATMSVWFSSTQLFVIAMVAAYCAWKEQGSAGAMWRSGWLPIAGLFLYLSIDETAQIHELIGKWVGLHVPITLFKKPVFYWLLAYLPAIALAVSYLGLFFWRRFRRRLPLLALVGGGLLIWMTVLGLEAAGGLFTLSQEMHRHRVGWEEFFEMAGATCFLTAFLRYATTLPERTHGEAAS